MKKIVTIDNLKNYEGILDSLSDSYETDIPKNLITRSIKDIINNGNRWTIEVCLYLDNKEKMEEIIDYNPKYDYLFNEKDYGKVLGKMLNNKTDTAYKLINERNIVIPTYIKEAMEWIRK